jgi:DNA-binding transcriptional ArsR family regulator
VYQYNQGMTLDPVEFAKILADDTRQEIMKHLCCVWLSVSDVVDRLGGRVNQPTVSHHLKKLEDAGLVSVRQEGRQRFYTLNQERVVVCCGQLVSAFAPDYASHVVRLSDIGVSGVDESE